MVVCIYAVCVCVIVLLRYAVPLVQKVLEGKSSTPVNTELRAKARGGGCCVQALILVPSKELSRQATANIKVSEVGDYSDQYSV